jgi:hypothetical protein
MYIVFQECLLESIQNEETPPSSQVIFKKKLSLNIFFILKKLNILFNYR